MDTLLALLVGALVSAGVYALLRPNLLRIAFGLVLLSNAVNLLLMLAGRIGGGAPLVPEGATAPVAPFANPLPQALVLTAIVISFGLTAFALVLVWRHVRDTGRLDSNLGQEHPSDAAAGEASGRAEDDRQSLAA